MDSSIAHITSPEYIRSSMQQSLERSSRPKTTAEMFDIYMRQKAAQHPSSASFDPELADLDRREAEARKSYQTSLSDQLSEIREEASKHQADPKRKRWSAIASAATDAITGIAGMIGVANGAVHPASLSSIPSASKVTSDYYDDERKKRRDALSRLHDLELANYKQVLADVEAERKRHYEKTKRERDRKKQEFEDSLQPYRLAKMQAEATFAANNARLTGAKADTYPAYSQSQINKNNRTSSGSGKGKSKKPFEYSRSLPGFGGK